MNKKFYLVLLAFLAFISLLVYGIQFVIAHTGGGTAAHGDTINIKIQEVWVGTRSSDAIKVFSGPSDGPVTVTATKDQWMKVVVLATTTTVDSVLDNTPIINLFRENGPDIGECVFWKNSPQRSQRWYMDPPDTRQPFTSGTVETLLKDDGVADDRLGNDVTCWFGDASGSDPHTVSDFADLIVRAPGGPPPPLPTPSQCSDGKDNDGDGLIDLNDPGCINASDNDEVNPEVNIKIKVKW